MIPGAWVFGYETGGTVRSVSVIADSFPDPASVQSFTGIVSFIGNVNENGSFYVTVDGTTLRVLPDSLCSPEIVYGDYAAGFRIGNDILLMRRIPEPQGESPRFGSCHFHSWLRLLILAWDNDCRRRENISRKS